MTDTSDSEVDLKKAMNGNLNELERNQEFWLIILKIEITFLCKYQSQIFERKYSGTF